MLLCDTKRNNRCRLPLSSLLKFCRMDKRSFYFLLCRYHWGRVGKKCDHFYRPSSADGFADRSRACICCTWTLNNIMITLVVAHINKQTIKENSNNTAKILTKIIFENHNKNNDNDIIQRTLCLRLR